LADVKISALPASTTPLAGTEVLPIVQSSTTRQVSVANLTAGRAVSALSIATTTGATFATTSGSVGIGTASPTKALTVSTNTSADGILITGSTNPRLQVIDTTNSVTLELISGDSQATIRTDTNHPIVFGTNGTERMTLDATGVVGIGTSSPNASYRLNLSGTNTVFPAVYFNNTTSSKDYSLRVSGTDFILRDNTSGNDRVSVNTSGIVTMSAYGAGTATFSAAGVISSVSDETWKVKDGVPTNTDAMLQKLEPGYWFYNEEKAPTFGEERQLGFYAQNVHEAIGEEAAPTPQEGKPWGYHDRSVLAIAVMSLKNALNTIEELKQRIETLENK
jgi:hypothetical protein